MMESHKLHMNPKDKWLVNEGALSPQTVKIEQERPHANISNCIKTVQNYMEIFEMSLESGIFHYLWQ